MNNLVLVTFFKKNVLRILHYLKPLIVLINTNENCYVHICKTKINIMSSVLLN